MLSPERGEDRHPLQCTVGVWVLLFLFTIPQAEHEQFGFSRRVTWRCGQRWQRRWCWGCLSLSQVPFKPACPKVQGTIPWLAPCHIPGDQRHIWTLPLLSFPVPVAHCPLPHLGANLSPS